MPFAMILLRLRHECQRRTLPRQRDASAAMPSSDAATPDIAWRHFTTPLVCPPDATPLQSLF